VLARWDFDGYYYPGRIKAKAAGLEQQYHCFKI
jgi:hypothetical protein